MNEVATSVVHAQQVLGYVLLAVITFAAFGSACFIWGNSRG
jgi:hypothetical protein